jgi:hypothetical protein
VVFGIVTGSVIVPVFVIEVREDVNVLLPETVPELEIAPELEIMPEFETVPELERDTPDLIVSVWPELIVSVAAGGTTIGKLAV